MSKRGAEPIPQEEPKRQKNLVSAVTQTERTHDPTGQVYDEAVVWEVMMKLLKEVPLRVVPRGTVVWHGGPHTLTEMPRLPFYTTPCDWTRRFGTVGVKLELVRDAHLLDLRARHRMGTLADVGTSVKSDLFNLIDRIVSESTTIDDETKAKWGSMTILDDVILAMPLIDGWLADELAPCHNFSNIGHIDEMLIASERLVKMTSIGPVNKEDMESSRFFATEPSYQSPDIGNPPPTLEEIEEFEYLEQEAIKANEPKDRSMEDAMRVYETDRSKLQQLAVRLYIEEVGGDYHTLGKLWRTVTKRNRQVFHGGPALMSFEKSEYDMLLGEAFRKMYPDAPYRTNMWKKQPEEEYVDEEMPEDDEEDYSDDDY